MFVPPCCAAVPPGKPVVATNSSELRENDVITLSCSSSGGNPAPNITWYRNANMLTSSIAASTSSSVKFGTTSGSLVRRLTPSDDRTNYSCVVWNKAAGSEGVSTTLQLNVQC